MPRSLRASWRATTAGACAASRNMRVVAGSRLLGGRAELGDEVVGITTEIGLAEFGGAAVAQEAHALHEEPGVAFARVEQAGLLGIEEQRPQSLQRPHRPV